MRLLQRAGRRPPATTIRPAEPYLAAGAAEARRLRHDHVATAHVLAALVRRPGGSVPRLLARLGVGTDAVEAALAARLEPGTGAGKIDARALAELGIDLDAVRARLEQTFGPGALERARSSCLGISPRLKLALAHAVDLAGDAPLADEHVLLGLLSVPDSAAARALARLNVSLADVGALLARDTGAS